MSDGASGAAIERRLMAVALRRMSDQCEMPELTPGCPFFEVGPKGPQCGEQCLDVLAERLPQVNGDKGVEVWDETFFVRRPKPRPRRGPEAEARAFDATEVALRDKDRPTEQCSTVSLLLTLRDQMQTPPHLSPDVEERRYTIQASAGELRARGLPVDDLLRRTIAPQVGGVLTFSVYWREMAQSMGQGEDSLGLPEGDPGWRHVIEAAHAADGSTDEAWQYAFTEPFQSRFMAWARTADESDLIRWAAPEAEAFLRITPEAPSEGDVGQRADWLMDRSTRTYLDEWSESSLMFEWDYLHAQAPGCCAPDIMRERRTDVAAVAKAIAEKARSRWKGEAESRPKFTTNDFTTVAVENLEAGHRDAAVAIFSAVVAVRPDDWEGHNNLGFCLVPEDALSALGHLEKAAELLDEPNSVNLANRVLALHLVGRDHDALALGESGLGSEGPAASWQWVHRDGEPVLSELVRPSDYLGRLLEHIRSDERWKSCNPA
jgi:hypothetical protein